jgi:FkbM family methyltransferase
MRKVFIDLGMYNGDSIEQFYNWYKLIDNPLEYEIFGFEPNPGSFRLADKKIGHRQNVVLEELAAWTEDGEAEFAVDDIGSTVMKTKRNWDSSEHITVKTFDFSRWLKARFREDCFIVLKMDIEGAEFPLLEKMIKDGTDKLVNELLVEFHPNKVSDYTTTHKNDLIQRLTYRGVEVYEWH